MEPLLIKKESGRGAMIAAMDELACGHGLTLSDVRPLMSSGFPWDQPDRLHPELCDPQAWWDFLETYLVRVAVALGVQPELAGKIAKRGACRGRLTAVPITCIRYPINACQLKEQGYRMVILSNHVPELPQIVQDLGLTELFAAVLGSAQTAVGKAGIRRLLRWPGKPWETRHLP